MLLIINNDLFLYITARNNKEICRWFKFSTAILLGMAVENFICIMNYLPGYQFLINRQLIRLLSPVSTILYKPGAIFPIATGMVAEPPICCN